MNYVAVIKRDPNTELQHWKYIKKKKINGKWRYYYDEDKASSDIKNKEERYEKIIKKPIDVGSTTVKPIDVDSITVKPIDVDSITVKPIEIKENILKEDIVEEAKIEEIKFTGSPVNVEAWLYDRGTMKAKVAKLSTDMTKSIAVGEKWVYKNVLKGEFGKILANTIAPIENKIKSWVKSLKRKR